MTAVYVYDQSAGLWIISPVTTTCLSVTSLTANQDCSTSLPACSVSNSVISSTESSSGCRLE